MRKFFKKQGKIYCLYLLISHLKSYWHHHVAAIPSDIKDNSKHLIFLFSAYKVFPDHFQTYCNPEINILETI